MLEQRELKELNKETIRKQLDQINKQLKGEQTGLENVRKVLARIPRARLRGDLAAEYDRAKDRYAKKAADLADKQSEKIRKALDRWRNALQKGELLDPDPADDLRPWIKELKVLDLKEDEIPVWNDEFRKLEAEAEDVKSLFSITEKVRSLWERAKDTEENNGSATNVIEDYKQAVDVINGALKGRQITWGGPKQRLENLLAQAEQHLREARQRHEVTPTKVRGVELVNQYKSFLKEKPDRKITYPESAEPEAQNNIMTVSQAIPIARDLLIRFWDSKIEEYTRHAQDLLDQHDISTAEQVIQSWRKNLTGFGDPALKGEDLSYEAKLLIEDVEKQVAQAKQKRETAEGLCRQAIVFLGTLDYADAIRSVLDAEDSEKADPFVLKVKETKSSIQSQMLAEASNHIQNAENRLNEGDLEEAGEAIGEAAALLGISLSIFAASQYLQPSDKPSLLTLGLKPDVSAFTVRIQKVAKTLEDIEKTIVSAAQKIQSDPAQAKKILDNFVRKYGKDQVEQWESIQSLVDRVEINYNAKKTLSEIQALVGPDSTIVNLEKAHKKYASIQDGIPQDYHKDFESIKQEIDARLGYLKALELEQMPMQALELLKPALGFPALKKQANDLGSKLKQQIASDAEIAEAIKQIPHLINDNPAKAYRDAHKYEGQSAELDELIQQARDAWEMKTIEEIERLSSQTQTLNSIERIRSLLKQLKEEIGSSQAQMYEEKCRLPCALAEAALLEKEASKGKVTWETVAGKWDKVIELSSVDSDRIAQAWQVVSDLVKSPEKGPLDAEGRKNRALDNGRQVIKRQNADSVSTAKLETQIEVYGQLNGEFRGQDAEVLRWLGEAHLNLGAQLTRNQSGALSNSTSAAREHFEQAERYLEAAQGLETRRSSSQEIDRLIAKARSFRDLEEEKERIALFLQRTQISVGDCVKAKDQYLNARIQATKTDSEYAKYLASWWEDRVRDAREIIKNQAQKLPQDADLFAKISPWICILVLSDDSNEEIDAFSRVQMLNDVIRELEKKIDLEVDDFSASMHDDIYGRFNSGDLSDEQKKTGVGAQMQAVLDKQIDVCATLRDSLREPQSAALIYCNLRLPNGEDLQNRLIAATQRLDEWIKRLRGFKKMVGDVKAWADASLRTGDFTSAKKALGSGSGNPNPAFLGFSSHPTYIWLDNYVDGLDVQWSSQQEHKQTIEWCFRFEHATTMDEIASIEQEWERENVIAGGDIKDKHRALVRKLRAALKDKRQYPLEFTVHQMKAMQSDDPVDACSLQGKLKYDPNKPTSELDGLKRILPVFQARVDQLNAVEAWLTKITGVSPREDWEGQKDQVVGWWARQRGAIEEKRDTGFLKTALEMCERLLAEEPTVDGLKIDGFAPLGYAHKRLEELPDSLMDPQPKDPMLRDLREKRDEWATLIDAQVAECDAMLKNIQERRKKRDDRKDLVLITLNNLRLERERTGRFHFRNRLADRTREFRQAIEAYKEICLREEWFLEILKEEGLE